VKPEGFLARNSELLGSELSHVEAVVALEGVVREGLQRRRILEVRSQDDGVLAKVAFEGADTGPPTHGANCLERHASKEVLERAANA